MKASVEVICYMVRPMKNGEYPLMLRITKSRKRKYVSMGMSVDPKFWDFDKNKPKRNCPNRMAIEKLIATKETEYNNLIIDMTAERKDYTPQSLAQSLENKQQSRTVEEVYNRLIADLEKSERLGNAAVYKYSRDSLIKFTHNTLDIPFSVFDSALLKRYEDWLRIKGCKETTISQLFRTLRSVFNKALELSLFLIQATPKGELKNVLPFLLLSITIFFEW